MWRYIIWIFVCLPKSDLRPPWARFNKFINFSARWSSKRSLLKSFRWTYLWEGTSRDLVFLVNFLANFPLRISCQHNFYPLNSRFGNHFGVCSVNVEMIVRTTLTAETQRGVSTYILHSHSALTETKRKY
jgi:hypothetical protein